MKRVVLSYDFAGTVTHDRRALEWKFARDGYVIDDATLIICWARKRETIKVSDHITVESFRAVFGAFRPVYDLLFVIVAPLMVRRHAVRPGQIVISEWPLSWGAGAVKLLYGGDIVIRLIGLPRDLARTRSPFHLIYCVLSEWLTRFIPDRCVAVNDATRAYAIARGIPASHITVLPLDSIRADRSLVETTPKGLARKELGIPDGVPFLLSVGRLQAEKGFDELIDMFAAAKLNAWLVILGEGALRGELETRVAAHPDVHIVLSGNKSREDIWKYFKDADVFVLLSRSEGLGLVVWEAMYADTPVIGRPVGGIKETIGSDGLRGFFWDTRDGPAKLREKVERCIARDAEIQAMAERAKAFVGDRIAQMG